MAREKKGITAKKKVNKVVLYNPWEICWPILTYQNEQLLLEELQKFIVKEQSATTVIKIERSGFVFGLNAVTRAVEKNDLSAVILEAAVKPVHLVQHIVPLCASRSIPVICHRQLNTAIAKMINISSLVTLGIKRSSEAVESPLHNLLLLIQQIAPPLPPHLQEMYCRTTTSTETVAEKDQPKPKCLKNLEKAASQQATSTISTEMVAEKAQTLPKCLENPEEASKPSTLPSFLSLSTSSLVPLETPPSELDTLSIRIMDPNMELQVAPPSKAVKRKVESKSKKTLVSAKIKFLQSSGKTKKKLRRRKRGISKSK